MGQPTPIESESRPTKKTNSNTTELQTVPRGRPKSGRLWKTVRTERHSSIKKVKSFKSSWAEKMEKKKEKDRFKDEKNRLKEDKANEKRLRRQRTEANKKKKAENQRKAEVVQTIKDTRKIKKMRKKQLRMIETR